MVWYVLSKQVSDKEKLRRFGSDPCVDCLFSAKDAHKTCCNHDSMKRQMRELILFCFRPPKGFNEVMSTILRE